MLRKKVLWNEGNHLVPVLQQLKASCSFISEGQRNATTHFHSCSGISIWSAHRCSTIPQKQTVLHQLRVSLGPSGRRDAKKVLKNSQAVLIRDGLVCGSSGRTCPASGRAPGSSALPAFPPCWKEEHSVRITAEMPYENQVLSCIATPFSLSI